MTGRKLYDHYCDAVKSETSEWQRDNGYVGTVPDAGVRAWPFLHYSDRAVWNALARRITPKPRKAS